jgi:mRNA interferase MazF
MVAKAQGQIWWANLPEPLGWRPVLILTRNDALPKLHYVTVAPLTRTIRRIDSEVVLEPEDGVPARSAVTLDNIATIEQDLLTRHLTTLSADRMNEIWEAIHVAFEMPF